MTSFLFKLISAIFILPLQLVFIGSLIFFFVFGYAYNASTDFEPTLLFLLLLLTVFITYISLISCFRSVYTGKPVTFAKLLLASLNVIMQLIFVFLIIYFEFKNNLWVVFLMVFPTFGFLWVLRSHVNLKNL